MNQKLVAALAASSLLLFLGCPGPGPNNDGGTGGGTATGGSQGTGGGVATGGGSATGGGQGTGGGTATGGGTTSGTFTTDAGTMTGALAFPIEMARAVWITFPDGGVDPTVVQIALLSQEWPDVCSVMPSPMSAELVVAAVGMSLDGGNVKPGTYPITTTSPFSPSGGAVISRGITLNDGGQPRTLNSTATGTITLNTVTQSNVTGSFDAVLQLSNDGGTSQLSGTFEAPGCNIVF